MTSICTCTDSLLPKSRFSVSKILEIILNSSSKITGSAKNVFWVNPDSEKSSCHYSHFVKCECKPFVKVWPEILQKYVEEQNKNKLTSV